MKIIQETKTKIKQELTKKRSIKNKKLKKALFVIFLLFVDCYVIFNVTNQLKANWTVHIVAVNADDKVAILRSDDKSQAGVSASLNVKGGDNTPPSIEDKIKKVFGDEWKVAYAVMKAESQGDASRIGDKHLITVNKETGERIGDSIGLFQIRTGSKYWNRCKKENLSCDEFRKKLLDEDYNIAYAKKIRDAGGWEQWTTYKSGQYKKFLN